MKICGICNKEIPTYTYGDFFPNTQCLGGHQFTIETPYNPNGIFIPQQNPCEHCYCQKIEDHMCCCNCGNRQKEVKNAPTSNESIEK